MGKIEWAMWANEQALATSAVVILGGVIAVAGQFKNWQFGVYGIVVGVLVLILEYPRGARKNGKCLERKFTVPCCFILPTLLGGMCFFITSAIYFTAAIKGEEWKPVLEDITKRKQGPTVIEPPRHPPPRHPPQQQPNDSRV
ncbi:cytochrome b-245 light chain isoform X2 [Patella vulgata]|uniref:cytochrome b-245 light chain isoform X2 n=1 Tax=Patella vulgata TaxID=6465 RepID=UPI00217FB487|nr:cytochrome b-245 light chain isoform X2 [Patella vulgata]